jgi:hypothetical protein
MFSIYLYQCKLLIRSVTTMLKLIFYLRYNGRKLTVVHTSIIIIPPYPLNWHIKQSIPIVQQNKIKIKFGPTNN